MAKVRLLIVLSMFVAALRMDAQCTWVEQTGQIVQDCGKVGIGLTSPWTGLHLKGSGQSASNPELTSSSTYGSVLLLQDTGGNVGHGGMIGFGAVNGQFAAIKGSYSNGAGNTQGHLIFATRNASGDSFLTERMRISDAGLVSITGRSQTIDTADSTFSLTGGHQSTVEANTTQGDYGGSFYTLQNVQSGVTNLGSAVGSIAQGLLNGSGTVANTVGQLAWTGINGTNTGTVTKAYGVSVTMWRGNGAIGTGYGYYVDDLPADVSYGVYQAGGNDGNYFAGKVGIGTLPTANTLEVVGNANFTGTVTGGNIQAKYQDLAEWVPSNEDLAPGTVVVLDPEVVNSVRKSSSAYDTAVAGVVSAQPGILLGEGGASKEQIATTGRVKVRVDASKGAIAIGDLLVTSDKAGVAMRSQAIEMAGRRMHQPGTIIGKALEPLARGEGEILVLLSLQ